MCCYKLIVNLFIFSYKQRQGGGPDGNERVLLPEGTYVQVDTFARHHNPDLWGPDVMEFNPDRAWYVGFQIFGSCLCFLFDSILLKPV